MPRYVTGGGTWTADMHGKSELADRASHVIINRYRSDYPTMPEPELAGLIAKEERLKGGFGSLEYARRELRRALFTRCSMRDIGTRIRTIKRSAREVKRNSTRPAETQNVTPETMVFALSHDYARSYCDRHPETDYEKKRAEYEGEMTNLRITDPLDLTARFYRFHPAG